MKYQFPNSRKDWNAQKSKSTACLEIKKRKPTAANGNNCKKEGKKRKRATDGVESGKKSTKRTNNHDALHIRTGERARTHILWKELAPMLSAYKEVKSRSISTQLLTPPTHTLQRVDERVRLQNTEVRIAL